MGAKDWMVFFAEREIPEVLASRPALDRDATMRLVEQLFPDRRADPIDDVTLAFGNPDDGEVWAAAWPGAALVCAADFALDRPSTLDPRVLEVGRGRTVYLHAMHSVVDWFAFAIWEPDGSLRRSLSLSPDHGVMEDVGDRLPFEQPFWAGDHPAVDPEDDPNGDFPFAFHPLELAEHALGTLFGFVYEGPPALERVDPEGIPLAGFRLAEPRRRLFGRRR